jgi:minor extracellular serine protease Vpr
MVSSEVMGMRIRVLAVAALTTLALLPAAPSQASAPPADGESLYLVTLRGPGVTGYRGPLTGTGAREQMQAAQDRTLAAVGAAAPTYRWTDALNGYAVPLTEQQAAVLGADPAVALVEPNEVRPLAAAQRRAPGTPAGRSRGGAGVVVGIVDSGLWPESPLFAGVPGLGERPRGFRGTCQEGAEWTAQTCNRKVVGARWYVDGFGATHVRASAYLSPRDESGHGTQVASVAAGNARVSVHSTNEEMGTFAGVAPQARLAVYKACWTAPDPDDDGCATADIVTAVDQATQDGVDVLNLSVAGPEDAAGAEGVDTVDRALLGAAEADIVVVAAAGNDGGRGYAAHATPWVTTVGASTAAAPAGRVSVSGGPTLDGSMVSGTRVRTTTIVLGARVAAPGADPDDAALCVPGSLDAALVGGAIVVCERGTIGRVDKSAAVRQADGAGMVLANTAAGTVSVDIHAVPTVHLDQRAARRLTSYLARHPRARATLRPAGTDRAPLRVVRWSSAGDPRGALVKPDLVAPGTGRLGAVTPRADGNRFAFFSGTSAATAHVAGVAALLRSRHDDWSAPEVRSALTTSARALPAPALRQGAGRSSIGASLRSRLVLDVGRRDYRRYLDGGLGSVALNTTSLLVDGRRGRTVTRRVTNLGDRAMYFSSSARGFVRHRVTVTPAALRLQPGESATFRVRISGAGVAPLDDGYVGWLGADGSRLRLPVVITR